MAATQQAYPPVPVLRAGLRCRCPRCGTGALFAGYLTVAEVCGACGLNMQAHDSGDGPAVFVMFVVGAIVTALALLTEVKYTPPLWVHAVLWPPLILGGSLALLRPFKGVLIALQYRYRSTESDSEPGLDGH